MKYFDLHCDTITECYEKGESVWQNQLQLSIERGAHLSPWVQVYAIWLDDALSDEKAYDYFNKVKDYFQKEVVKKPEEVAFCKRSQEIRSAMSEGKKVALLAIEGSRALGNQVERVQEFYDQGVRMMTLTWNGRTAVADGCMVEAAGGLTDFGREVVAKMNEVGMLVDVSHLSEKGFWDVVRETSKPFIATHSNSKTICQHPRNLTDEQFKVMVERKCLVGMNFYPLFINGTYEASIEELMGHMDYLINLGGEQVIAMGSDFDGAKMPGDMRGIQDIAHFYQLVVKRYGKKRAEQFFFENAWGFMEKNI